MNVDEHLVSIGHDAEAVAACAASGDLTAAVAACPDWNVRDLVLHTGGVHRWATRAVQSHGQPPEGRDARPADDASGDEIAEWFREGAAKLIDALGSADPDDACWHPFPFEQSVRIMARRQSIETMMHRWDAETATSGAAALDPARCAEGILEYFELGLPRVLSRHEMSAPDVSLHVHCTDDGLADGTGEWLVWNHNGEYHMEPKHQKGDAALRGRAEDLLLVLMGRRDRDVLDIVGDESAAAVWLDLPGW